MPTTLGDKLRKNGKKPSCEPCRVRKQSCDHEQPCQRCQRHNRACFYAAAPMTKPKLEHAGSSGSVTFPSPSSDGTPTPSSSGTYITAPIPMAPPPLPPPQPKTAHARKPVKRSNPLAFRTGATFGYAKRLPGDWNTIGHTGKTAFSAILEEAVPCELWWNDSSESGMTSDGWDDRGLEFCKEIIAWLPKRDTAENIYNKFMHGACVAEPLLWKEISHSFWETWGPVADDGSPKKIRQMIEQLVHNTRNSLHVPRTNEEFLVSFMGKNMRWEHLGHIFINLGDAAISLPDYDPILSSLIPPECEGSKRKYACTMLECADACLMLSEELDPERNVFTASLRCRCVTLQSVVQGDSGLELWRKTGAMVNTFTGLGLHLELKSETEPISALYLEFRSMVFHRAFILDKTIASFTGRPPALSRRYVTTPMQLDLPPEIVYRESNHAVLKSLVDPTGWGYQENPAAYSAAFYRGNTIFWEIRDEILEVSLGRPGENLVLRAAELREKQKSAFLALPTWFREEPAEVFRFPHRKNRGIQFALWLTHLRNIIATNCLLIERITIEGRDETWMLSNAKFMLNNVLLVWNNREHCIYHRDEIHWSLSCYGIPAASALALDLLRQTNQQSTSHDRSEVIQQLSVFLAALDWVKPEDGNYALCCRLGKMIKQILDRALSPASSTTNNAQTNTLSPGVMPLFDPELQDFSMEGLGNDLGLLGGFNDFEWTGGLAAAW